ncbi:MAG: DUF2298 domain-containing protein [Methylacidiphilales bacterium]|nr:DUF2298 domain-containing protein [Candidatus Methylacidiphilales bacterium]
MTLLLYIVLCLMILTCVTGAGLAVGIFLPRPWVALCLGPWIITTIFFAIEGVVPLGRPGITAGIVVTLLSVWLIFEANGGSHFLTSRLSEERREQWRKAFAFYTLAPREAEITGRWAWFRNCWKRLKIGPYGGILIVLFLTFSYAMCWRYPFPNVDSYSEKIADLSYITSYLTGTGVPAQDYWCSPYPSIQYYSFQHYAAALMGRAFQMGPGLTYNLGFCLLIAMVSTTGIASICTITQKFWVRCLCGANLVWGGTGMSGIIYLFCKHVDIWNNMRFINCAICNREPWGIWVANYQKQYMAMDLPGEPLAYSIYLSDYHAPLSGLYLLFLGLLLIGSYYHPLAWETREGDFLLAAAGATLPWCLVANTWSFPLQGLLIGGWVIYQLVYGRLSFRELAALSAGGMAALLACLNYLSRFLPATQGYNTSVKLVPGNEHTPPLLFILFFLPTVITIIIGLLALSREITWAAAFWLFMLVFVEFVFIDDLYSGTFDRFNTTLKWWPWVAAGTAASLAPLILQRARNLLLVIPVVIAMAYPLSFTYDLGYWWWDHWSHYPGDDVAAIGNLNGDAFLLKDPASKVLYRRLKEDPIGLTMERPEGVAFTNTTLLTLMAGQPSWLGWLGHEQLWRGDSPDLYERYQKQMSFYDGSMTDYSWLWANHIRYILWYKPADTDVLRLKINDQIKDHYHWVETFFENRDSGYWELNQ